MKLHLPKILRHAVLACVAAVAGVTTTIGTATFTGGLVAVTLAGHQARADWSGNTYSLNSADTTLDASGKEGTVTIMAGDAATYVLQSLTMANGQQLLIAQNPEGNKNIEKLTITDLTATNANITIQADQTLALGQAVMTAANKFASIQVEGTLDLTAIENLGVEYGQMAEYSKNWSKMTGSGTVKLAKGLHLQSAGNPYMSFSDYFVWLCQQCPLGPADPSLLPAAPLRPLLEVIGSERRQRRNCAFCSVCWPCPGCLPWLSPFTLTLTAEIGASSTSLLQMQSGLREAQPVAHRPRSW